MALFSAIHHRASEMTESSRKQVGNIGNRGQTTITNRGLSPVMLLLKGSRRSLCPYRVGLLLFLAAHGSHADKAQTQ